MGLLEMVEADTKRMDASSAARMFSTTVMFCDTLQAGVPDIHDSNLTVGLKVFHWWGNAPLAPRVC